MRQYLVIYISTWQISHDAFYSVEKEYCSMTKETMIRNQLYPEEPNPMKNHDLGGGR
jgi:hypothetical protein